MGKTVDRVLFAALVRSGEADTVIAERTGCTLNYVRVLASRMGLLRELHRSQVNSNDAKAMTDTAIRRARMEEDAVRILERVLHRHRWSVPDRDALADALERVVLRELKAGAAA